MSSNKPFILVTGGTGFLGSHIVHQLLEGGYRVRCIARPLKSRFLEAAHIDRVRAGQLEVVEVNDLAKDSLEGVLNGITAVIHAAFPAPGSMDGTELLLNATSSTTSLLRQAYDQGIRKFVLTSSYLAMVGTDARDQDTDERREGEEEQGRGGVWSVYVFSDRDWTHATYDSVFKGSDDTAWAYTAAKTLAETAAWDFASSKPDFDLATVLPTLLFGPFAPGHAILSSDDLSSNIILHSLLTSGTPPYPVWPHFVDVRDAARAHVEALEAPNLSRRPSIDTFGKSGSRTAEQPPKSGLSHLAIPSSASNPSLLDLGTTLQNFQSTAGSPTLSLFTPTTSTVLSDTTHTPGTVTDSHTTSPTTIQTHASPPRKRFVATGASFTWPEAIAHLRTVYPDLSASLPDERACLPLPGRVAGLEAGWCGTEWVRAAADDTLSSVESDESSLWKGLDIEWRDWRETIEDAVRDLRRVAGALEKSGWEDLFGDDDEAEPDEDETQYEGNTLAVDQTLGKDCGEAERSQS